MRGGALVQKKTLKDLDILMPTCAKLVEKYLQRLDEIAAKYGFGKYSISRGLN